MDGRGPRLEKLHDFATGLDDFDALFAESGIPERDLLLEVLDLESAAQQCVAA